MEILLIILSFLALAAGLLGVVLPVLPGPPLSFLGLLLLQWSGRGSFSPVFLWVWAGIALIVTVMDYILPSFMTKKFGGSRLASIGSFLGIIAGLFFFPPWGMIAGPFLGAFTGELIHSRSDGRKALKAALGAFLAFIAGAGAKLIVCSMMIYFAVRAVF